MDYARCLECKPIGLRKFPDILEPSGNELPSKKGALTKPEKYRQE